MRFCAISLFTFLVVCLSLTLWMLHSPIQQHFSHFHLVNFSYLYLGLSLVIITLVTCFGGVVIRSLWFWRLRLSLYANGSVKLDGDDYQLIGKRWLSPMLVVFAVRLANEEAIRQVVVWQDMLSDTNYRHLCRWLNRYG
ncbi:protein YgfX [Shewanella maritima]|uniref:protein YgfX n=1 Tax=Shewanella maritima TaxID=2520507 RepID=UPI003BF803F8